MTKRKQLPCPPACSNNDAASRGTMLLVSLAIAASATEKVLTTRGEKPCKANSAALVEDAAMPAAADTTTSFAAFESVTQLIEWLKHLSKCVALAITVEDSARRDAVMESVLRAFRSWPFDELQDLDIGRSRRASAMRTECEADAKLCGMDFGHAILEQANQLFHLSVEGHVCKARLDALEVFENFVGMVKSVPGCWSELVSDDIVMLTLPLRLRRLLRGIFVLANIEQNVNWPSALDAAVVSHGHGEHVRGQYELEVLMQVGDIDIELDPDRLSSNFRDHLSCKVRRLQQAWSEVVRGVIEKFHERIRQTWLDEEYRKLDKEYQFVRQLIVQKAWERLMGTLQQGKQSSVCVSISVEAEGIFCVFQDAMVTPTDVVDL